MRQEFFEGTECEIVRRLIQTVYEREELGDRSRIENPEAFKKIESVSQ